LRSFIGVAGARLAAFAMFAYVLMMPVGLRASESAGSEVDRMSTPERVHQEIWWPTKLPESRQGFVGSATCSECHEAKATSARDSEMTKALLRPRDSDVLRTRSGTTFELDSFLYKLEQTPQGFLFSAGKGGQSASLPITWAFGDGNISQVYFTEVQGKYYESHFSYYGGTGGFDRTTNQGRQAESISAAIGRVVSPGEARRCFACHATAVTANGGYEDIGLGVLCEACHGPGADHVAAMKSGVPGGEGLIMNPSHLAPTASVDFCGSCHMTWVDVGLSEVAGPPTTRFPAYGLLNSRCWGDGDTRITCVGCHDPHQPLVRGTAKYDYRCLACHVTTGVSPTKDHPGQACPTASRDCASCHMPRVEFADSHHAFTDHEIRVVRTSVARAR